MFNSIANLTSTIPLEDIKQIIFEQPPIHILKKYIVSDNLLKITIIYNLRIYYGLVKYRICDYYNYVTIIYNS